MKTRIKGFLKASFLMLLIALGFGCQCNKGSVKVKDTSKKEKSRINVELSNMNQAFTGSTNVLRLTINGTLINESGSVGSTSFNRSQSYERGGTSSTSENFPNLRPGKWEVSISFGNWNTRCEKTIPKNGVGDFDFRFGRQGCE